MALIIVLAKILFYLGGMVGMGAIINRAGFSTWWLLVAFIPVLNVVMLLVLAFSDWPRYRELRFQAIPGIPPDPKDGPRFIKDALWYEQHSNTEEAIRRYEKITTAYQGLPVSEDAAACIRRLNQKVADQRSEQQ